MSTKTLRKRIALVAVSALGFGLVSAAPSSAAQEATVSIALNKGAIVAGSEGVTVTVVNTSTISATKETALVITSPTGAKVEVGSELTLVGATYTGATATATYVVSSSLLLEPGTYTFTGVSGGADSDLDAAGEAIAFALVSASAKSTTLVVSTPATSTAMASGMSASAYAVDTAPVVRAWRPTNGVSGSIKFRVDRSADVTPALGTVFAATTGATGNVATYTLDGGNDDTAGTYIYTAWVDTNGNDLIDGSEPSTSQTFVVSGAAATVTATLSKTSLAFVAGYDDFTITATVTDSLGRAVLGSTVRVTEATTSACSVTDVLDLTDITANEVMTNIAGTNTYTLTRSVDAAPATAAPITYVCVYIAANLATAITDEVITAKALTVNQIGNLGTTTTGAGTLMTMSSGAGIGSYAATGVQQNMVGLDATDLAVSVDPSVTSITYTGKALVADAGKAVIVTVTPKNGTTAVAGSFTLARILADGSFSYTVAATFADTNGYTVTFTAGDAKAVSAVITFAAPAPAVTTNPATNWTVLNASTNSITATLADQYGRPMASKQLVATVAGRNPGTTVLTTDATGTATLSVTDTSTSTVLLTDSIQFTYNDLDADGDARATSSTARVITYAATLAAVGTVTVVHNDGDNTRLIDMVGTVASTYANVVTYTATVKTAAGAPVGSGVLVTFAGNADDKFYGNNFGVTTATSNGQVTVLVYRNKIGYSTITATANGTSSTTDSSMLWANAAGDARFITVTPASKVVAGSTGTVIATVTDRYANPVANAQVTFSLTGAGRLQAGSSAAAAATDLNGQRQIQVTSNDTEFGVVSITASHAGARGLDAAGIHNGVAASGLAAGNQLAPTTVTFEKSTATSTADALLALATALGTRDQASAAVDAAAEATDAANAATDAANAAAEAADAATAAAQDAADAVAALSTQVSEMVAALKKQITSLTNLVIKIQKKVKA